MDAARYRRLRGIVEGASRTDGSARDAYLNEACAGDAELRGEAEQLLSTVATGSFLGVRGLAAPPPPHIGPYRLGPELGAGGMGVVHEATDTRSGVRVALKLLHAHIALFPTFPERFEREAQLGARIEHANVVRTFDAGVATSEGSAFHYIAMEFVEGQSLRQLLTELTVVPEALVREIALQASDGLAAIHEAGVVHRDLKPENMLISADRCVRIMDLGVAKLPQESVALTREGQFLGSLQYASPEQCDGRPVGPASDLYSLGVVLYELATGQNPFALETPGAILRAHLDLPPPPAGDLIPDLSPFLAEVLATLLSKDPAARFASAEGLHAVLRSGEQGEWWDGRERLLSARGRPRTGVRRATSLHGRRHEVETMERMWGDAQAGHGGALLLEGEGGIGKSRLVDEFLRARSDSAEEVHLLYGSFPPESGMRGVRDALLEKFGRIRPHDRLRPYVADAAALGDFMRRVPEAAGGGRIEEACADLIAGLASEHPTVWVFEDLHFAPRIAQHLALAVARAATSSRALVILTARGGVALEPLLTLPRFTHLPLSRLEPEEVRALARETGVTTEGAERAVALSGGIPFLLLEVLGGAGARGDTTGIPRTLRDLMRARVGNLSAPERELLDIAATYGFEFDADALADALERPAVALLRSLAEMERRLGIVRPSGRLFRFDHHLVQEVIYGELAPRLREEYHSALARALTAHPGPRPHLVVWHGLRGKAPPEALPALQEALRATLQAGLIETHAEMIERALPHTTGADRIILRVQQASALGSMGRFDGQGEAAREAHAQAEQHGDRALLARTHLAVGGWNLNLCKEEEALTHIEMARTLARDGGDGDAEVIATRQAGLTLMRMRRQAEAIAILERAHQLARARGSGADEAIILSRIGHAHRQIGQLEAAVAAYERALPLAEAQGDRRTESSIENSRATALWCLGRFEEADLAFLRAVERFPSVHFALDHHASLGNRSLAVRDLGRLGEAYDLARRHLEGQQRTGARRAESVGLSNVAHLELRFGLFERVRERAERALEIALEIEAPHVAAHARVILGTRALWQGDPESAMRMATKALEEARRSNEPRAEADALILLGASSGQEAPFRTAIGVAQKAQYTTAAFLAAASGGEIDRAQKLFEEEPSRIAHLERMAGLFCLWEQTRRDAYHEEARRLLESAIASAPAEYRATMRERVPLHVSLLRTA